MIKNKEVLKESYFEYTKIPPNTIPTYKSIIELLFTVLFINSNQY